MDVPSIKRRWSSYSFRNKASYSPTPNHLDTGVSGAISGLGTRRNALCVRESIVTGTRIISFHCLHTQISNNGL